MTQLSWGDYGERYFETGVDRGVLYVDDQDGVVWNGLVAVNESSSGADTSPYYLDGIKYTNRVGIEDFSATIEAYTYPEEFALCDGSAELYQSQGLFATQQRRKSFGLSYRTRIGNDDKGVDFGYKIHIIYNALATPSERQYQSLGDETEPNIFSWELSTTPVVVPGVMRSAHLVIDTRQAWSWAVTAVEEVLYGTEDTPPTLPSPQELMDLFADNALLKIIDNGDGTWTAEGPDEAITMLTTDEFQIAWPSAVMIDEDSYEISSL
jgi:hypothetical protein